MDIGDGFVEAGYHLDVKRKACPIPVILMRDKLKEMKDGEVIEIITDFASCKNNIERAAMKAGHEVLGIIEDDGNFRIYVKKK